MRRLDATARTRVRHAARRSQSTTALALILTAQAMAANAGPSGGVVVGGSADISRSGSTTTIRQDSNRAIIDWQSFDIAPNEAVKFQQPSARSVALNRAYSATPTQIEGTLSAPGNVWVLNRNGVMISDTARINVGGFVAGTADIDNADFMAGNYRFDKPGRPDAEVINRGSITFGEAGLVGLAGPTARNEGTVVGTMGRVVVAGTDAFAIDLAGDGILALPTGTAPELKAVNTGTIDNAGGQVLIDAATAEGVLESAVFADGSIEASSFEMSEGRIVLSSGDSVEIAGTLDATGLSGAAGGEITVTGERLKLTETARLDASGDSGGGLIRIGGDRQGGGSLPHAGKTLVEAGAELRADARATGDGGSIVVWSDDATGFFGSLTARGGPDGGDGGFAEISGGYLEVAGDVDLSAAAGRPGELLLDPDRIVVGPADGGELGAPGSDIFFSDPGTSEGTTFIAPEFITSVDGSLTLQAVEDISVLDVVDNRATGRTLDLRLEAGNGILIAEDMFIEGSILFDADAGPFVPPPSEFANARGITVEPDVTVSASGLLDFNVGAGDALTLLNGASLDSGGGLELPATEFEAVTGTEISVTVRGGDLTQQAGTSITGFSSGSQTGFLRLDALGNDINLPSTGNSFTELAATGNDITIGHSGSSTSGFAGLTTRGIFATGNLTLDLGDRLSVSDVDSGVTGDPDFTVAGNAHVSAQGSIFTFFDATVSVDGNASFMATDDQGDANPLNDSFFNIFLTESVSPNRFGGTVSLVGSTVVVDANSTVNITDSYAESFLGAESFGGDVNVTRLFTGTRSGAGPSSAALMNDGAAVLESDTGSISAVDVVAADLELTGDVTFDEFENRVVGPILGDVTVDDFETTTLTVAPVNGDMALSDGSVDTLAFQSAANISLTSVDIIGRDPLSFPAGTVGPGGTLTLNGVRGTALTGNVPNLALGFLEVGSIDISSSGDIEKVPDTALAAGDGGDAIVNAPSATVTGLDLGDRSVNTGAAFTNLIRVDGNTTFNGGLTGPAGDILLPHAETGGVAFHNDFVGPVVVESVASVAMEDANALTLTGSVAGDLAIRGDSDRTGADGDIVSASLAIGGKGTFLTESNISLSGSFGGLQLVGANADVSSPDDLTVTNSRLSGDLFLSLTPAGSGTLSAFDTQVAGDLSLFNGAPGGAIDVTRTSVGGAFDAETAATMALTDFQVGGNAAVRSGTTAVTRAAIGGDLTFGSPTGGTLTTVALQDTAVGGGLAAAAASDISAAGLRVGGAAALTAGSALALSDFAVGSGDFLAPSVALSRGRIEGALAFADGLALSLTDVEVLGSLDTGLADALTLSSVSTGGELTVSSSGVITADNLSAAGAASFSGTSYDLASVDIGGLATFTDSTSLAITDGVFGGLDFGANTQGVVTGERIVVANDLTGASASDISFADLQVGGNTILSAAADLTVRRFAINGFALGTPGTLSLEDGIAAAELTDADVGSGQGAALMTSLATPAAADLRNLRFDALQLDTTGTARLSGVRTAGPLAVASETGDVLLGQIDARGLTVDAPGGSILTRDGADDPFFAEGFAQFTIFGPHELFLPDPSAALADVAGPGDGGAVTVGIDTATALGDAPTGGSGGRVVDTLGPIAGVGGAPALPAAGTRAPLGNRAVTPAEPALATGVVVSGTTSLAAGGDVRIERTNLSAPQPSQNFLDGPVIVTSGGAVSLEAADLAAGVIVDSGGDATLASDGSVLLGQATIGGDFEIIGDAEAAVSGFGDGAINDGPVVVHGEPIEGPILVLGALRLSQGGAFDLLAGDDAGAVLSQVAGLDRDITLDNPGNVFGPSAQVFDVTGNVTLIEEQTQIDDSTDGGLLAFGPPSPALETLGSITIVTPDRVELRDDVTLASGESLSIDTSSGDGAILVLGALSGTGDAGAAPDVTLTAGSGDVSFFDLVGIADDGTERRLGTVRIGPAGDVLVSGVEPLDGNVFVADALVLTGVTGDVGMNVPQTLEDSFAADDVFFGVDLGALDFSGSPEMRSLDLFGSIAGNASVTAGLLPTGEPSPTRFFNGCLIGDPSSCVAPPPETPPGEEPEPEVPPTDDVRPELPSLLTEDEILEDEIAFVAPYFETEEPLFELPDVDFSTLFSATGNENLWSRTTEQTEDE